MQKLKRLGEKGSEYEGKAFASNYSFIAKKVTRKQLAITPHLPHISYASTNDAYIVYILISRSRKIEFENDLKMVESTGK